MTYMGNMYNAEHLKHFLLYFSGFRTSLQVKHPRCTSVKYIYSKTPSCTTQFTNLKVTNFGLSIKYRFFVWLLILNRYDDGLIEKPKLVTSRFVNFVMHDGVSEYMYIFRTSGDTVPTQSFILSLTHSFTYPLSHFERS